MAPDNDRIISPETMFPKKIITAAVFMGTPKTKAATVPLQAPVKGIGIPTKIKRAIALQTSPPEADPPSAEKDGWLETSAHTARVSR